MADDFEFNFDTFSDSFDQASFERSRNTGQNAQAPESQSLENTGRSYSNANPVRLQKFLLTLTNPHTYFPSVSESSVYVYDARTDSAVYIQNGRQSRRLERVLCRTLLGTDNASVGYGGYLHSLSK